MVMQQLLNVRPVLAPVNSVLLQLSVFPVLTLLSLREIAVFQLVHLVSQEFQEFALTLTS